MDQGWGPVHLSIQSIQESFVLFFQKMKYSFVRKSFCKEMKVNFCFNLPYILELIELSQ